MKSLSEHENWDLFRHFLKLIQIFGEFIMQYEQLEDDLVKIINTNFIKSASSLLSKLTLNEDDKTQFQLLPDNYKDILLDENDRIKLNTLISNIESGNLNKNFLQVDINDLYSFYSLGDDYNLIPEVNKAIFGLSEQLHRYAFDIVFSPIKFLLNGLSKSNV